MTLNTCGSLCYATLFSGLSSDLSEPSRELNTSIQTLLKPTVCLPLMRRCTSE